MSERRTIFVRRSLTALQRSNRRAEGRLTTQRNLSRISVRSTGPPWNLTFAEAVVKTGLETAVVRACRPTTAKSSQPNDCVLEWRIDAANPTAAARTSAKQTREQVCRPRRSPGRPGPAGGRAQAGAARTAITGDHAASAQSRSRWPRSRPPRFSGSTRGSRWHSTQFSKFWMPSSTCSARIFACECSWQP